MKKISILLAAVLLVMAFTGCGQKNTVMVVNDCAARFVTHQQSAVALQSDGTLWVKGPIVEDSYSEGRTIIGHEGEHALTQSEQEALPAEILPYLDASTSVSGVYQYHKLAERVAGFNFDANTLFVLTIDGKLYDYRGLGQSSRLAGQGPKEALEWVLLAENVCEMTQTGDLSFVTGDGKLIVNRPYEARSGQCFYIKGAEEIVGASGQRMTQIAKNVRSGFGGPTPMYIDLQDNVWICGYNGLGVLGNGSYDDLGRKNFSDQLNLNPDFQTDGYNFRKFGKVMSGAEKIFGFDFNCFVIKKDGSLWAWGANEYSNCGTGTCGDGYRNTVDAVCTPTKILDHVVKIDRFYPVTDTETGESSYIALTADGSLYTWGSDGQNTLGNGEYREYGSPAKGQGTPYKVLTGISDFAVSQGRYRVAVALANDGKVYCWGGSLNGEAGTGKRVPGYQSRVRPTREYCEVSPKLVMERGRLLSDRSGSPSVIDENGDIWSWGNNPFGWSILTDNDPTREADSTYGLGLLVFASPVKNPQISALIGADGSVSFEPTPIE